MLSKVVKASRSDAADWPGMIKVFMRLLAPAYPKSVVIEVLRHWSETNVFWPAWAELKPVLDRETRAAKIICRRLAEWQDTGEAA